MGHSEKVEKKYLGSFEVWCWKRTEKIIWTNLVKNEEILYRVKKKSTFQANKRQES
jgi:hypothetical protein